MTLPPELREALDDLVRAQQAEDDADEKYSALWNNRSGITHTALDLAYDQCEHARGHSADTAIAVKQVYRRLFPRADEQSTAA